MKAVERMWDNSGDWHPYGSRLKEEKTWMLWWDDLCTDWYAPLTIRYDNGQLCTFRRRHPLPQNNERG